MYEKTTYVLFTMQRYGEKLNYGNLFNESAYFFSEVDYLKKKTGKYLVLSQ